MGKNSLNREVVHAVEQIREESLRKTTKKLDHTVNQGANGQGGEITAEVSREANCTVGAISRVAAKTAVHVVAKSISSLTGWGKSLGGEREWDVAH